MKKFFLTIVAMAVALSGCNDYSDEFNAINDRLDKLEEISMPSIEEQIESVNQQLASLRATDEAIKTKIADLESSDNATDTEIADLKAKDSALEKAIGNLQGYIDNEISKAKSEAAAAYATIEQYNTIVAQLSAVQTATNKLGEDLTAKIDAEAKSLNDKIADLENRLKVVEKKIEELMARIQSVSYVPQYSDGKATIIVVGTVSQLTLDFQISPKDLLPDLAKVIRSVVSVKAVYTKSRAVSFVDMPLLYFDTDIDTGIISLIVSGENLSQEFFAGTQEASVALTISDGNNSITSDYIPMVTFEAIVESTEAVPTNEIWYTSIDGAVVTPYSGGANQNASAYTTFGANITSNTYENGKGVILFDAPITQIGEYAFYNCKSLKTVTVPYHIETIDLTVFEGCDALEQLIVGKQE